MDLQNWDKSTFCELSVFSAILVPIPTPVTTVIGKVFLGFLISSITTDSDWNRINDDPLKIIDLKSFTKF